MRLIFLSLAIVALLWSPVAATLVDLSGNEAYQGDGPLLMEVHETGNEGVLNLDEIPLMAWEAHFNKSEDGLPIFLTSNRGGQLVAACRGGF